MFVLLYRGIKFPKSEHGQRVIYVENFFLYFEYDDFLTYFTITVVLFMYASLWVSFYRIYSYIACS